MNSELEQPLLKNVTYEQIEWHVQRAHRMRNEAIADMAVRAFHGLLGGARWTVAQAGALLNHRTNEMPGNQRAS